jgi:Ca2+/Na+ antiporter
MKKLISKLVVVCLAITTVVSMSMLSASAAMDSATASAMGTSFTNISDNVIGAIVIIVPVALGIVAIFLAWKYGMKFFKGLTNKG